MHRCFICDKGFGTGAHPDNLKSLPRGFDPFSGENAKLVPYHEVIKHLRSSF